LVRGIEQSGGGELSDKADTELDRVIKDIEKAIHVVDLLVILLKICRRHASKVLAAGQDRDRLATDEATRVFTSQGLSKNTRQMVIDKLQAAGANFAVTARALAIGIDVAMQSLPGVYTTYCALRPVRVLKPGDPYPTPSVNLSTMYGRPKDSESAGFSRQLRRTAATAVDSVSGLALWPSASTQPLRVVYNTLAGAYLDRALVQRNTVDILALVPNRDFWGEFEIKEQQNGGFFGVHPKDAAEQERAIEAALHLAREHEVDIVVTPELSSTEGTVALVNRTLSNMGDGRPRMVIVGGLHWEDPKTKKRRNRMSTIYAGPPLSEFTHDKIGEFVFHDGTAELEEGIARSTELTIHAGNIWSMVTLICADLLDDAVVDAVADLCPRLVIVPSMSAKTGDYEMSMGAVIRKSQALVMVVNGPPEWSDRQDPSKRMIAPMVIIGMPLANSWITRLPPQPPRAPFQMGAPPYRVLFCSGERSAKFI